MYQGELIEAERFKAFLAWSEKQDRRKIDMVGFLENLIAWNDEYPEEERGVVDLVDTADNLNKLLQAFAAQVRGETLQWVADHLYDALEVTLDDEGPQEVDWQDLMDVMVQEHNWKEAEDEQEGEDAT